MKKCLCLKVKTHTPCVSIGLLLLRAVAGVAFVIHGWGKIQNPFGWMGPESDIPGFFQLLAAFSEFGGGFAWVLGFLTQIFSAGIGFTMHRSVFFRSRGIDQSLWRANPSVRGLSRRSPIGIGQPQAFDALPDCQRRGGPDGRAHRGGGGCVRRSIPLHP